MWRRSGPGIGAENRYGAAMKNQTARLNHPVATEPFTDEMAVAYLTESAGTPPARPSFAEMLATRRTERARKLRAIRHARMVKFIQSNGLLLVVHRTCSGEPEPWRLT
jgi:hypothetical protein